jgi:hypothetical protein
LLKDVHAQHPRHADRLATHATRRRIRRFDQRFQVGSRHNLFHFREKLLALDHALLLRVLVADKAQLLRGSLVMLHRLAACTFRSKLSIASLVWCCIINIVCIGN